MDRNVPFFQCRDFGDIDMFYLHIGNLCNMQCRHCARKALVDGIGHTNMFPFTIQELVKQLLCNYVEYALERRKKTGISSFLRFSGGEVLLSFDSVRKVITELTERYGILREQGVIVSIVSNGLLLDDIVVKFLNEQEIDFGFSYDAPYPWAVRGYVSDTVCGLVETVKHHFILATCGNAYNYDFILALQCLKAKFPKAERYRVEPILTIREPVSSDITEYDWKLVKDSYRKLRIAVQTGDKDALSFFSGYVSAIKRRLGLSVDERLLLKQKEFNRGILVMPDGNISVEGNTEGFRRTVNDSYAVISGDGYNGLKKIRTNCSSCRHTDICDQKAFADKIGKDGKFLSCSVYWLQFYDILKNEIKNCTCPLKEEDIIWFRQQEKFMNWQVQDFLNEGKRYEKEHTRLPKGMMK